MNFAKAEPVVKALLYEGYILYPYRASNVKNQKRFAFGTLSPRDDLCRDEMGRFAVQTECLIEGSPQSEVEVHARFLHLVKRDACALLEPVTDLPCGFEPRHAKVASLKAGADVFHSWEEAAERDAALGHTLAELVTGPRKLSFSFPGFRAVTPLRESDGKVCGLLIYTSEDLQGELTVAAGEIAPGIFHLSARVENVTPGNSAGAGTPAALHGRAFASTHTLLGVRGGAFISLLDPPDELKDAAAACRNEGTWPVLIGETGCRDTLLSSPVILYDYPQIAPESPADLFDATEIDELLTLRILTMTESEKREMAALDPRGQRLLETVESLTQEDLGRLHGAWREPRFGESFPGAMMDPAAKPSLAFLRVAGCELKAGDRVRLKPKGRADAMDLILKDEIAVIESIERDYDNRVHVAVVLESDPGREFGLGRMPGHRFFFSPEEIEPFGKTA
jgi:hypothetical protein